MVESLWYDPLAPMPLHDVIGHRHLLQPIARAVARESLPPSLLFTGPDGVGKRLVAEALAQVLNCPSTTTADAHGAVARDACGRCSVCRRIARGGFPDVTMIEPGETGWITVEPVRDATQQAAYRPFEGRRRVVVIDQADRLVAQAQNALLKTLEEPPASSQFLLITARPDTLLPTVRSRCPQLRFGRLSAADVAEALMSRHEYDEKDARSAAAVADGSIGRALDMASREVAAARDAATGLLGSVAASRDPRARLAAAQGLVGGKPRGRGTPAAGRAELTRRLQALASLIRDLELLLVRADVRWLANADLAGDLTLLVPAFDRERCARAFSAVGRALDAVDRNASPKVVADWLACQL